VCRLPPALQLTCCVVMCCAVLCRQWALIIPAYIVVTVLCCYWAYERWVMPGSWPQGVCKQEGPRQPASMWGSDQTRRVFSL
jgi:hypothetical protein